MEKLSSNYNNKILFNKKILFLAAFFIFNFSFLIAQTVTTTITIKNARQTSYKKEETTGNDLILLEGSVEISVQNGNSTSEISAEKITYNRNTEILFAEGNVQILTKASGSGGEKSTANSLLLNTSTMEGIFDGGKIVQTQSDAINLPSGSTLIVFSDLFGKDQNNTIAFKNSSLTFCDDELPHWHIKATRTWLLPGGEFAFFNALLYVGVVPVFYFPAFYYPKDELVFNPVFSLRKREGYSIQTTTYLMGRKGLDSGNKDSTASAVSSDESLKALYNFMKPTSLKKQKLEGLVLHNLDEDYKGDTSEYVKLMADWYSKLGFMVGLEGNLKPKNPYVSNINFAADLGFSNRIYQNGADYSAYNPATGEITKDESDFMGLKLPFRYYGNFAMALNKPFNFSVSLPVYSDPFFNYDFMKNRSETMDWISYFVTNTADEIVTPTEITSFAWKANGSYSPVIPAVLKPYISSASISFNSQVDFSSKTDETHKNTVLGKFYYPSSVTPVSTTVSMSGTLYQYPKKDSGNMTAATYDFELNKPEELKSPSELEAENTDSDSASANLIAQEQDELNPELPVLDYSVPSVKMPEPFAYKLGYTFGSTVTTQISYNSKTGNLNHAEDFSWKNVSGSMYNIKMPVTLNSNMNYYGNFISVNNSISYNPVWQQHPKLDGYDDTEAKNLKLADYRAESQTISNSNTVSFKPFIYSDMFDETGLSWNSTIRLYQHKFTGDADNPAWENVFVDWDDSDCITVNSLNLTLGVSEMNKKFKQNIVFSAIMPPLLRSYSATLNLTFPYVNFSLSSSIKEPVKDAPLSDWTKTPLAQNLTFAKNVLDSPLRFTESYNYNLTKNESENLKLSLSWYNLTASYVCANTNGATFKDSSTGWVLNDEVKFRPYSLSFAYNPEVKTFYTWFNRITFAPTVSTNLSADLIRPTNSYFVITPALTFKITDFFYLQFSATSRNSVMYRYFQKSLGHEGLIPGEENIFKDLLDSFAFGNEQKRQASGFKLKSMNLTMTHELHDWKFNMTMKIEPRIVIDGSSRYYDYSPYISIGVVWNPMESMKTTVIREPKTNNSPELIWKLNSDK